MRDIQLRAACALFIAAALAGGAYAGGSLLPAAPGSDGPGVPSPADVPVGLPSSTRATTAASLVPTGMPSPAGVSPTVGVSFDALSLADNSVGLAPPDPILSVGPTRVVEMVNLVLGVYTKQGGLVHKTALSTFFGTASDFISDPKVQYDPGSGRWFATVTDVTAGAVRLAVSASADPNGTWKVYSLSDALGSDCLDQPILGVGGDKVVVSVNAFSTCTGSNPAYLGAEWWVLAKADLVGGLANPATQLFPADPSLISDHPAQANSTTLYMVATNWTQAASAGYVILFRLTGLPPLVVLARQDLAIRPVSVPPPALQFGSNRTLDTGDIRVLDAAVGNGTLWLSLDTACTPPGDLVARACARLVEIDLATPSVAQDVDVAAPAVDYFYPALRTDARGDLLVVLATSSTSTYPSVAAATRIAGDPPGTIGTPIVVRAGTGPETCSAAPCRFGDYSGAAVDPSNPATLWAVGQFGRGSAGWGTHVFSASVKALLDFRYRVVGGGNGFAPPILTYVEDGATVEAVLTSNGTTYATDPGTPWSVSGRLGNSSSTEWWSVDPAALPGTSGVANASSSATFTYYHQYAVAFAFALVGNGSPTPPVVSFVAFGRSSVANAGNVTLGVDAGSSWSYPAALPGSTPSERWEATGNLTGIATGPRSALARYYHQYRVTFAYEVVGGTGGPAPGVAYTAFGAGASIVANDTVWADEARSYAYDPSLSGPLPGQRWQAGPGATGTIGGPGTVTVAYREQYLVTVRTDPAAASALVQGGGWYDAGSVALLQAHPTPGWRFAGWSGAGAGASADLSVAVLGPLDVTATFDVGLTIVAGGGGSVAYTSGMSSGVVAADGAFVLYVPAGTIVSLTAQPGAFVTSFAGWSGAASGTGPSVSILVTSPGSVRGDFATNGVAVLGLVVPVGLVLLGVALLLLRQRRQGRPPGR